METLTRMVADSLARHGFDRPVDPRRLQWSRWFRCDSPHSLLVVPSKPGIFALAEEVMDLGPTQASEAGNTHVRTAAFGRPAEQSSAAASSVATDVASTDREGQDFSSEPALSKRIAPKGADTPARKSTVSASEIPGRRMLAVLQFSEDDDMAFTLDRMFTRANPMRARFSSGHCFLRFVVIEDQAQRRSICAALNQWMLSSAEKASGIGTDFQSSLELTTDRVGRTLLSDKPDAIKSSAHPAQSTPPTFVQAASEVPLPHIDSGANKNLHCPHPSPPASKPGGLGDGSSVFGWRSASALRIKVLLIRGFSPRGKQPRSGERMQPMAQAMG
ncbi:MAG TPA: hypothetical protein VNY51_14010 [Candidatus Dormibacteraeota bacterium]|jgi:hypothetical protein|nr:hypothetical protein [Candidatus Dormibacteraeota bacterium]